MPRPKVLPANRLRVSEACLSCRASKKRCSGTFPCSKCIRNGRAESCVPFRRNSSSSSQQPILNNAPQRSSSSAFNSEPRTAVTPNAHLSDPRPPLVLPSSSPGKSQAPHKTHSRMLKNLQGERVYIGRVASLSFLQWLRDIVTQHIGPSQFSHNVKMEDMLEAEALHDMSPLTIDNIDPHQEQIFLQACQIATSGYINVLSDLEISQMFEGVSHTPENSKETKNSALRDIMIAIGAQSCKNEPGVYQVELGFFDRAQRAAFAGMLENPSLELVRLFILMSFYMLGACRRNAAFMYLGVATRAATALGLHLNDPSSLQVGDEQKRTRIWMSLCVLDLLVSSILGRPPATANLHSELLGNDRDKLHPSRINSMDTGLVASYQMSHILDEIIVQLYNERAASTDVAESLLEKLKQWSTDLPETLLSSPSMDQAHPATRRHIIGSLHVACAYHFAVIIVTRPFLISVLGVRLARLHQGSPGLLQNDELLEDPAHGRLASACIDSASYMIQTCMEVYQSGILLGNMCILKALIFAAALIPGFSMFCQKEVDSTLEEAFNGALEILRVLARQSAQAAHYCEILSLLRNAIDEQRQRLRENPQPNKKYVSKLFSLKNHILSPGPGASGTPSAAENSTALSQSDQLASYPETEGPPNLFDTLDMAASFTGWEGLDLTVWDRFPFIDDESSL